MEPYPSNRANPDVCPRAVGGTQRFRHGLFSNHGLRFGALDEVENSVPPEFLPGKSVLGGSFLNQTTSFRATAGKAWLRTSEVFKRWVLHVHGLAVKDAYRGVRIDETVSEARATNTPRESCGGGPSTR